MMGGVPVRAKRVLPEDRGREPIRAGERGAVIGFQGGLMIVVFSEDRTATAPEQDFVRVFTDADWSAFKEDALRVMPDVKLGKPNP